MAVNNMQTGSSSSSPTRFDTVAVATLVGIVFVMAISAMNLWNLKRVTARVATIEAALSPRKPSGPDPTKIHSVNIAGAQVKGPANAPVTIVEFSDFQCPFCARVVPTLKRIEEEYKDNVRIVWKHLPLEIHKDAVGAALAAESAAKQGKFWEFHDVLFANQKKLGPEDVKQHAKELRLDMKRFETDLLNSEDQKRIDADVAEAKALGINGTPGIFVNGRFVEGAQPYEVFAKIIDEELAKRGVGRPSTSTE